MAKKVKRRGESCYFQWRFDAKSSPLQMIYPGSSSFGNGFDSKTRMSVSIRGMMMGLEERTEQTAPSSKPVIKAEVGGGRVWESKGVKRPGSRLPPSGVKSPMQGEAGEELCIMGFFCKCPVLSTENSRAGILCRTLQRQNSGTTFPRTRTHRPAGSPGIHHPLTPRIGTESEGKKKKKQ